MSLGKDGAIDKARKLVALLNSNGFDVYEAYMFGSAVMNEMNEYSDIDVAIVSDKFTGVPFYDALKISKFRRAIDLKLEVHPFLLKDILNDPPIFFIDIKSKGIRVN
jgi:predicted nucleotidyltransferase